MPGQPKTDDKLGKPAKAAPAEIDWERIEAEYRADVLSLREIAALHPGVSHTSIARKAKAEGWGKDLRAKIDAKANEIVTRRAVTAGVTATAEQKSVTEKQVVEAAALAIADVRLNHRSDIRRYRALCNMLLAELEHNTEHHELYRELADVLEAKDKDGNPTGTDKLNEIYRRVIGMPQRVDSLKKLAETLKVLIGLEREAYGMAKSADDQAHSVDDGQAMSAQDAYMRMIGK